MSIPLKSGSGALMALAGLLLTIPATAGVHAHYSFDSGYNDSSGNARHGTLTDVGTVGNSAITSTPADFKFGGGAMNFSADRDFIAIPSKTFSSGVPYSIAFWAKKAPGDTGESSQFDMVAGQRDTAGFFIALTDASGSGGRNGLRWRSTNDGTAARQADFSTADDTQWHHYAITASGTSTNGTITLYVDGVLSATATGKLTGFIVDTIGEAYTSGNDFDFNGQIDEMWIFDETLSATKVAGLYHSNDPDALPPGPPVTRLRIVLLGGQSNADGRATVSGLPTSPVNLQSPQPDVDFFHKTEGGTAALTTLRPGLSETSQFGPEITLGRKLADLWSAEAGTRIAIIKYANGGTNLAVQWKGGGNNTTTGDGPEYVIFQQTVTAGLAALAAAYPGATQDLQGMVWFQGESDAVASHAPLYQANLTTFVSDVRATYGADLPFIIARLSSGQTNLNPIYLNQVRAAQDAVAAADPRTGIMLTDSFGLNGDNLHFSAAGQQSIGSGFAEAIAYYEWMLETFTNADINAGVAEPDADRDGDGQSNRSEFLGGTNPLSGISSFGASYARTGPVAGQISYPTSAARFYSVQHYLEPGGIWETILPALKGTGTLVARPLDATVSRGIYRVRAELP
ncbi:MAG: sialate O-acetylesterase [Verrucomicrobiota bacterium]